MTTIPYKTILIIAMAIAAVVALQAMVSAQDQPSVVNQLSRTSVFEGESVDYTIALNNVDKPVQPKAIAGDDFDVTFLGGTPQNMRSVTIINGRRTEVVRNGMTWQYRLTPLKTGRLTIPAPVIESGGKQLQGRTLSLLVKAPEEQWTVRLEINTDRDSVYPMQPFSVTASVLVKALPDPVSGRNPLSVLPKPPALSIPWTNGENPPTGLKVSVSNQRWYQMLENRRGVGFNVNNQSRETFGFGGLSGGFPGGFPSGFSSMFDDMDEVSAFAPAAKRVTRRDADGNEVAYWQFDFVRNFVAEAPGRYTFGPASIKGTFATGVSQGQLTGEAVFAVARPITVTVKSPPIDGRPDSYIGAVGQFQIRSTITPRKVRRGDPMTLTLTLRGVGTLGTAYPPQLENVPDIAENYKIHKPTEKSEDGSRVFTYSVRPMKAGLTEFPAIPVSWFDVIQDRYITTTTNPISIEVGQAQQLSSRDITGLGLTGSGRDPLEINHDGLFSNITNLSQARDQTVRPLQWLSLLLGLSTAYGLIATGTRYWHCRNGDTSRLRRVGAAGDARGRLKNAQIKTAQGELRESVDLIQSAFLELVADTANMPQGSLTAPEAVRLLEQWNVDPVIASRVSQLLEHCESVRYGASRGAAEQLVHDADTLMETLITALRSRKKFR